MEGPILWRAARVPPGQTIRVGGDANQQVVLPTPAAVGGHCAVRPLVLVGQPSPSEGTQVKASVLSLDMTTQIEAHIGRCST